MKQIYDFEHIEPPALNEKVLRMKTEKQRVRRQTAVLAISGILFQLVMVLLGMAAFNTYPWITLICIIYILLSATGGGVIAVVFAKKGGYTYA